MAVLQKTNEYAYGMVVQGLILAIIIAQLLYLVTSVALQFLLRHFTRTRKSNAAVLILRTLLILLIVASTALFMAWFTAAVSLNFLSEVGGIILCSLLCTVVLLHFFRAVPFDDRAYNVALRMMLNRCFGPAKTARADADHSEQGDNGDEDEHDADVEKDTLMPRMNIEDYHKSYAARHNSLIKGGVFVLRTAQSYVKSVVQGAITHRANFGFLMLIAISASIMLPVTFMGACLCSHPREFSVFASRVLQDNALCMKGEICNVYLLLPEETSTEMVVKVHTRTKTDGGFIRYTTNATRAALGQHDSQAPCTVLSLYDVLYDAENRYIHTCHLRDLTPSTTYFYWPVVHAKNENITLTVASSHSVVIPPNNSTEPFDSQLAMNYNFTTLHDSPTEPIRFITGGDLVINPVAERIAAAAATFKPMFGVVAGDIAYANGFAACYGRFDEFFDFWRRNFGNLPMVLGIGNHEVGTPFNMKPEDAPLYFYYFTYQTNSSIPDSVDTLYSRPLYHMHKLGQHSSLAVLDSGCATPYETQADWLSEQYATTYSAMKNKLVAYHAPLFPSCSTEFDEREASLGRKHWQPIFDKYHVNAAFENHFHAYKRSKIISGSTVVDRDEDGTVYLGDGSWGVQTVAVDASVECYDRSKWYIEQLNFNNHVYLVESRPTSMTAQAINEHGVVFDHITKNANMS